MSSRKTDEQAQGGPVGKQTDPRHIRPELRGRWGNEPDQQRSDIQTVLCEEMFIHAQMKRNYCIRHHREIRQCGYESNTEQNGCFCFYRWDFMYFIFPFRYMQVLGDTINIPLCGRLPMNLPAMYFDSLSAITVKYLFYLLTVTAC